MPFHFFDHTGDIGVRLSGRTLDALFRDAAAAFTDSVVESSQVEPRESFDLALEAPAADLLLVDWVSELLYHFDARQTLIAGADVHITRPSSPELKLGAYETERHDVGTGLPASAAPRESAATARPRRSSHELEASGGGQPGAHSSVWRLHAIVRGERFDPARHRVKVLIKAVTYHALEVREDEHGWHGTVVFDI